MMTPSAISNLNSFSLVAEQPLFVLFYASKRQACKNILSLKRSTIALGPVLSA